MQSKIRVLSLSCTSILALSFHGAAYGQTSVGAQSNADGELETIMVTARRRSESLQEIPLAINVIQSDAIQRLAIDDVTSIAKYTPGFTLDTGALPNDIRPAIRGIVSERGRSSVALLVDGIDVTSESFVSGGGGLLANLNLIDLERIEIVKGPQSALYGRSAFGGAVNYITKRPSLDELEGNAAISATEEREYQVRGAIRTPIVEDVFAVGLNAAYVYDGGSFENEISGERVGGSESVGVAGSFIAQANEALTIYGRLEYSDDQFEPRAASLTSGETFVDFTPEQQAVLGAAQQRIFLGQIPTGAVRYDVDPVTGEDFRGVDIETFRASLDIEYDAGTVGIRSITGFLDSDASLRQDLDYITGPADGSAPQPAFQIAGYEANTQQISQEVRIYSTGDQAFSWLIGGLYWNEEAVQDDTGIAGTGLGPVSLADYNTFILSDTAAAADGRDFTREIRHLSGFIWAEYAFTDALKVSFEGRYTSERIDYLGSGEIEFFGVFPGNVLPPLKLFPDIPGSSTDRVKESYFTPRVAIQYQVNPDLNLYASVAQGVKPAGNNTSDTVFTPQTRFDREKLWAYEIGAKGSLLDQRLTFDVAAFYMDYTDQQVSTQFVNEANLLQATTLNAGASRTFGFEFGFVAKPVDAFTLRFNYVFLDAEFTEFTVLSNSPNRAAEIGCQVVTPDPTAGPICQLDYTGNTPSNVAKHQVQFTARYDVDLGQDIDGYIAADNFYIGDRFQDIANAAFVGSRFTTDLRVGAVYGPWEGFLFVNNLFDNDTVQDGANYVDFGNGLAPSGLGFLPDPRTIGARVTFTY